MTTVHFTAETPQPDASKQETLPRWADDDDGNLIWQNLLIHNLLHLHHKVSVFIIHLKKTLYEILLTLEAHKIFFVSGSNNMVIISSHFNLILL